MAKRVGRPKGSKKGKEKKADVTVTFKVPEGQMSHLQSISREKEMTQQELVECGTNLAQAELQLDQVRKEKKEANRGFDTSIKDHLSNIMRLSQAIDTGIITENVECDVVIDRERETKTCYPRNGDEVFILPMTPDDFDLLT